MGRLGRTKSNNRTRSVITILAALSLIWSLATPTGAYPRPGVTELASVASNGDQAHISDPAALSTCGPGRTFDISANGRFVVFMSTADNLVPGDNNASCDVFLRDRKEGTTERVSIANNGSEAVGICPGLQVQTGSFGPSVSRGGRFVAFVSCAANLVVPDLNGPVRDVYVRDRKKGTTILVSVSSNEDQALLGADKAVISERGRHVVFMSSDQTLTGDDSGTIPELNDENVFVRDIKNQITVQASLASDGTDHVDNDNAGTTPGNAPSVSANGRHVVFASEAPLVPDDTNQAWDVFVRDVESETTERVSVASDGTEGQLSGGSRTANSAPGAGGGRWISADGRFVTFRSDANNLVPNDGTIHAFASDMFVHDRKSRRTERITVLPTGQEPECIRGGTASVISSDGRVVAFDSTCSRFSSGHDTSSQTLERLGASDSDVYVHDRETGALHWASVAPDESEATGCEGRDDSNSLSGALSGNGRYLAFLSCADNLVFADDNNINDIFVRDLGAALGVGGFGGSPPKGQEPDDRICITPDLCIPPGAAVSSSDATDDLDDVLTEQGANLYGASLAYRPQYEDLFAVIELEHMPKVLPGVSPIFYGLRFKVENKTHEVRATSLLGGTFGLFDCTGSSTCTKVSDLRGGYGTTGMRVVFSLPLEEVGLESRGELRDVVAFSAIGSNLSGATKVLDTVNIK